MIKHENENSKTFSTSTSKQIRVYRRREHAISIYTMIRNKRNEIIDWIEYHRMIGIEHFYLYDHLSEDQIDIFLKYYLDQNIVTIIKWPFRPIENQHWNMIQSASMNHALKNFGPFNKWMGYFDIDEYFQLNSINEQLILSKTKSLDQLLDQSFPETKFPGGVQFYNCPISCFLSQNEILSSRHLNIFQKCNSIVEPQDCSTRTKLFIRPQNVPLMQNIHALEHGIIFSARNGLSNFGQFRHYNYGIVGAKGDQRGKFDNSMDKFIVNLTQRISLFYRTHCSEPKIH
ncbi:unnamed protein product [Rotaria sordida]|uniref:Glycosyltransferase family 92 protein n=1 Tax=Rotaria sordida TaxID=392033 RepID=A0A815DAI3_9BILA|nr:unnamed protein product [Rotaria sordida]